ncbi:hypothetical protein [Neolewinella litorea]|uniref:Uncharacterized protein n=1 Tax=Neolewinella litorea TaxID=2562452 RepID=A0A4S4NFU3_9BACT|nr:hypothetical protein [Neolewinella litorea]THH34940.1 hypothetical protein E4021_17240 [Neolewinella litorea]
MRALAFFVLLILCIGCKGQKSSTINVHSHPAKSPTFPFDITSSLDTIIQIEGNQNYQLGGKVLVRFAVDYRGQILFTNIAKAELSDPDGVVKVSFSKFVVEEAGENDYLIEPIILLDNKLDLLLREQIIFTPKPDGVRRNQTYNHARTLKVLVQ